MKRRYAIIEVSGQQRRPTRSSSGTRGTSTAGEVKIYESELSEKDVRDAKKNPGVKDFGLIMPARLINPVSKLHLDASEAPPAAWGIAAVGAEGVNLDGSGVVVAVLDTGIDRKHAAFAGIDIVERDFGGSGNGDRDGHGTHCAGTIFGKNVGAARIGIARNIRQALIAKVFPDSGAGDSLAIWQAMQWAASNGANIVSMSLGFDFPGMVRDLEQDSYPTELATSIALEHFKDNLRMFDSVMGLNESGRAFGRGPLVIAAAGNESRRDLDPRFRLSASLPSSATGVISVAAVRMAGDHLRIADFSNGRAKICAPGEDIVSSAPNEGFTMMSGTSMACPHVAGIAALWWQRIAESAVRANAETVMHRVLTSAITVPIADFDPLDSENGLAMAPV